MAFVVDDRIKETTTTTGTGAVTLDGTSDSFQAFGEIGDANTTYYTIAHQSADEFETGIGTYTAAGTSLARDTVISSSNSDALVSFSAGTKDVFVDLPASRAYTALHNFTATSAPGVSNDDSEDYAIGSRWIDVTNDKEYVALDVTTGAAVWTETTGSGGEWTLTGSDLAPNTPATTNVIIGGATAAAGDILLNADGSVVINETGASLNPVLRIESASDANEFYFNGTSGRMGIGGPTAPAAKLEINAATAGSEHGLIIQSTNDNASADLLQLQDSGGTSYISSPGDKPWQLEFKNTGRSVHIGEQAGDADDLSNNGNAFFGYQSGKSVTGDGNIGFGDRTMGNAGNVRFATAIGGLCMQNAIAPFGSTGIGYNCLANCDGVNYGTGIGFGSLRRITTGFRNNAFGANTAPFITNAANYNCFYGDNSAFNLTGFSSRNTWFGAETGRGGTGSVQYGPVSDTVYLGYRAGRDNTTSSRLFIAVTETASPLVYGEFNNSLIRINGSFETTNQVRVGTTTVAANGTKAIIFGDNGGTDPTVSTGRAAVFAKVALGVTAIHHRDSNNNTTKYAPHDPLTNEWVFESVNTKSGRRVRVNLERFFKEQFPQYFHESQPLTDKDIYNG
jgi:hypothetical protein